MTKTVTTKPVTAPPPVDASPRVALWQDGARLHYALAAALQRAGLLSALYTDWYHTNTVFNRALVRFIRAFSPAQAQRMAERRCADLQDSQVYQTAFSGLAVKAVVRLFGWQSRALRPIWRYQRHVTISHGPLATATVGRDVLFAFSYCASPELIATCRRRGIRVVLDQPCAPAMEIARQVRYNQTRWRDWTHGPAPGKNLTAEKGREEALLSPAHHLTCGSSYVRDNLVEMGIAPDRISVIPYPLDISRFPLVDRGNRTGPITVGYCGRLSLLKGAPWFLEVAKRCEGKGIEFTAVGGITLPDHALAKMRERVRVVGPVARSAVFGWLGRFDLLFFPSTNEGCPSAVMEAMATGLPIVTTPNSGTVVRHGIDGYIAPYDQPDILARHVLELAADTEKRLAMGRAARQRAMEFDIDFYSREIAQVMRAVLAKPLE